MDRRFAAFTLDEFSDLLERFVFSRRVDAVHMHHTWRPSHSQWRGEPSVVAMWRFHTQTNRWSDIAQHVTIAPDGKIWEGRDWNVRPASASGHNGSGAAGPFMFETVGDFDTGRDTLAGQQRAAVVGVIARLLQRFGLGAESLCFHREMTDQKTCPGTSVGLEDIRAEVEAARAALPGATRLRPAGSGGGAPLARSGERTGGLLTGWHEPVLAAADPADAELPESTMAEEEWRALIVASAPRAKSRARRGGRSESRAKAPEPPARSRVRRPRRRRPRRRSEPD